jgi:glutaredoxin
MKSTIELFTAGCPLCDPVIKLVKETATDNCEIVIYDLVKQCAEKTCINKMKQYGVNHVPSIVVNGKLLHCCERSVTKQDLINAGIGRA